MSEEVSSADSSIEKQHESWIWSRNSARSLDVEKNAVVASSIGESYLIVMPAEDDD